MLRETTMMESEGDSTQGTLRTVIYSKEREGVNYRQRISSVLTSSFPLENNVDIAFDLFLEEIYSGAQHRGIKAAASKPKNQLEFLHKKLDDGFTEYETMSFLLLTLSFRVNITYWKI